MNFKFYRQFNITANFIYRHKGAIKSFLKAIYSFLVSIIFGPFLNINLKYSLYNYKYFSNESSFFFYKYIKMLIR